MQSSYILEAIEMAVRTAQPAPVGGLFDFVVLLLERGINIQEGNRVLTVTLGGGTADDKAESRPAARPVGRPPGRPPGRRRGRPPGRRPGRPIAAKAALPAATEAAAPAKKTRKGRKSAARRLPRRAGAPGRKASSAKRGAPVSLDRIIGVLQDAGKPLDRHQIAKELGCNYHKLIRRMDTLVLAGKVVKNGQAFSIA